MLKISLLLLSCALVAFTLSTTARAENQLIPGAGPSTKAVQLFVRKFSSTSAAKGYTFKVPPRSIKHKGGISASSQFVFGRTGRPLNAKEKGMNKGEIILARIPIAFATGARSGISKLSLKQLKDLFTGKIRNWGAVGGTNAGVTIVGREKTEALFSVLRKSYTFFNKAKFNKILIKDHHVVGFLQSSAGKSAIAFGALPNFSNVNVIQVDGFSAGVAVGLVYDLKNKDHVLVKGAQSFAASPEWSEAIKQIGLLPPK